MIAVTAARHAMATRFEILLHGEDASRLRAAAEEALDEIERLDAHLSPYRPGSEIARLNAHAGKGLLRVEPGLFELLKRAKALSKETGGAFDLTVGPLMECWGLSRRRATTLPEINHAPGAEAIAAAQALVGMDKLLLDEAHCAAGLALPGMWLDLGAYGKGWAVERAADILREAGVKSALIHGGTSTICAMGAPPGAGAWNIGLERPAAARRHRTWASVPLQVPESGKEAFLAVIPLKDSALSVSATWGREVASGEDEGRWGHILDPVQGKPICGAVMAAVVLPLASESDAFSTALLVGGQAGRDSLQRLRPGMQTILAA